MLDGSSDAGEPLDELRKLDLLGLISPLPAPIAVVGHDEDAVAASIPV